MSTDLKPKRFTSFVVIPLDGTEGDALFDSGTDTESEDSEPYNDKSNMCAQ